MHRLLFGADMFRQDHSFRYGRARDTAVARRFGFYVQDHRPPDSA